MRNRPTVPAKLKSLHTWIVLFTIALISARAQTAVPSKPDRQPATAAEMQRASVETMKSAIEKQKAAVRAQVKNSGTASTFFITPWQGSIAPIAATLITPPLCDPMPESELGSLIKDAAVAESISPDLIRAVIRQESASYPCIVSPRGAVGLMQLMPATAQQFGVDPLDPKQNVGAGSKYLKQLLTRYKDDVRLALAAYNAGPARVDAINDVPQIPETTAYVDAILGDLASSNKPASTDQAANAATSKK